MFSVNNSDIKDRVCEFRNSSKLTQQDMAIYLGLTRSQYQNKESKGNFDWDTIVLLADFFNTSPYFIKFGVENEELRVIKRILNEKPVGTVLQQPNVTIFDDLEKYQEDTQLYLSFLNLDQTDQNRIIRYINSVDL